MSDVYTHEKKKKLAERISKLKKNEHKIRVYEIIQEENKQVSSNENGIFMLFHNLSDETYDRLEKYLRQLRIKGKTDTMSDTSEKLEYKPYSVDDFPSQEKLSPKYRYSNREKTLVRKRRYSEAISEENTAYTEFDPQQLDSEKNS